MYFALDPYDPQTLSTGMLQYMQQASSAAPLHWVALFDSIFEDANSRLAWPLQTMPLYQDGTVMADLQTVSPFLLALPAAGHKDLGPALVQLLKHCNGRPMLSIVASEKPMAQVCEGWQKCLRVLTPQDKNPYVLRFADTRVLPTLPHMPQTHLWALLTQNVQHWLSINRQGAMQVLDVQTTATKATDKPTTPAKFEDDFLVLDDASFAYMVEACEPDSVVNALEEQTPEVLPQKQKANFYAQVSQACAVAKEYKVAAFIDVVALSLTNHLTQGQAVQNADVLAMLQSRKWVQGELSSSLNPYLPQE